MAGVAKNQYNGWKLQDDSCTDIPRIHAKNITPMDFFKKFVSARRPCIIVGFPDSDGSTQLPTHGSASHNPATQHSCRSESKRRRIASSSASDSNKDAPAKFPKEHHLTNKILNQLAGDCTVKVEVDDTERTGILIQRSQRFGKGKSVRMTFSNFLQRLEAGDESVYLSTQNLDEADGGVEKSVPLLSLPPATQIIRAGHLPLYVSLMGQLVLSSINTWMGRSARGTSSGLHHDFHDNLYVLLRGKKTFQLWSPSSALDMSTAGRISHVYENGRICYEGDDFIKADGSWNQKEPCLSDSEADEVDDSAVEGTIAPDRQAADDDDDEAFEKAAAMLLEQAHDGDADDVCDDYEDSDAASETAAPDAGTAPADATSTLPNSFSTIDLSLEESARKEKYPAFAQCGTVSCTVHSGEMLFLPCGWFHNVTSEDADEHSAATTATSAATPHDILWASASAADPGHLAVNYWYHPPDRADFQQPYSTTFWADEWRAREATDPMRGLASQWCMFRTASRRPQQACSPRRW
eukprot:m.756959 g.756959  ORF g.756959 m.756959 type:complete len:523 (+) comp23186_c0_seq21:359-1927(+)